MKKFYYCRIFHCRSVSTSCTILRYNDIITLIPCKLQGALVFYLTCVKREDMFHFWWDPIHRFIITHSNCCNGFEIASDSAVNTGENLSQSAGYFGKYIKKRRFGRKEYSYSLETTTNSVSATRSTDISLKSVTQAWTANQGLNYQIYFDRGMGWFERITKRVQSNSIFFFLFVVTSYYPIAAHSRPFAVFAVVGTWVVVYCRGPY